MFMQFDEIWQHRLAHEPVETAVITKNKLAQIGILLALTQKS